MYKYCIEMYKCAVNRRVLLPTFSNKHHIRLFHRTTNNFIQKEISKCAINLDEEYFEKNVDELNKQSSNINFFGIESDEGVIIIDKHKSSGHSVFQSDVKKMSKEKFYSTSFGIIRHDSDNKIRYHGQYQSSVDFVFPHKSTDNSEVCRDYHKTKYDKFNSMYKNSNKNNSNYEQNLSKEPFITFDSNINASLSNDKIEKMKCNLNVYEKENEGMSYIDECFIDNMTEKEKSDKDRDLNYPIHELNYVDEYYFGNDLVSEMHESNFQNNVQDNLDKKFSYLDEQFFEEPNLRNSVSDKKLYPNVEPIQKAPYDNSSFIDESAFHSPHKISFIPSIENKYVVSEDVAHNDLRDENAFEDTSNLNAISQQLENRQNDDNSDISMLPHLSHKKSKNAFKYSSAREASEVYKDKNSQLLDQIHNKSKVLSSNLSLDKISDKNSFLSKTIEPSLTKTGLTSSSLCSRKADSDDIVTAHDFVEKLRNEQKVQNTSTETEATSPKSAKVDSKGFRIYKNQVPDLSYFTRGEIIDNLKRNILYSDDNLLILNKPYSLIVHESKTTKSPCLSSFLVDLAKEMDQNSADPKLFTVHRLDKETTGCLLLARNETTAQNLKSLFAQRKIIKKYWIVTCKVPEPLEGIIDIPVAEGSIHNKKRMVLHPHLTSDIAYRNHSKSGKRAVTSYKVLCISGNAALVETTPETGIKHQIRVHFGFGLSCPILGDHKYTHLKKLAPQKLPSDMLQRLEVRQSKVRHIPMHIHARSITIPEYLDGRNLFIMAPLPQHMRINLKRLKFKKKNKL